MEGKKGQENRYFCIFGELCRKSGGELDPTNFDGIFIKIQYSLLETEL